MATAARLARVALLPLPIVLLLVAQAANAAGDRGFRATLIRTVESRNLSLAAQRSLHRLSLYTSGAGTGTKAPVEKNTGGGDYIMEFSIGEPAINVWAEADTGSSLVWVKCSPCTGCTTPPSPLYDPTQSSSFNELSCTSGTCQALGAGGATIEPCTNSADCHYSYYYGSGDHYTQGVLGTETFTFADGYVLEGVTFGCSDTIFGSQFGGSNSAGLVGLSRGAMSLVSQLGAGRFAYCLAQDPAVENPILFGSLAALDENAGDVSSTPLIESPVSANTYYYVNLTDISVGGSHLSIPDSTFAFDSHGGGGVIFDSGTRLTLLADAAYKLVRQAVMSEVQGYTVVDRRSDGWDLCFQADMETLVVPTLLLHFDGADMTLNKGNYFVTLPGGVVCMAIMSSTLAISIIGNVMQTNFRLLHDVDSMMLSFQAADCGVPGN